MDLEEAKGQEIAKLQNSLQEMQAQLDESQAAIIHEREAAKIAIEQAPPVIKEVPVVDDTKLELLTNKNEELEVNLKLCPTTYLESLLSALKWSNNQITLSNSSSLLLSYNKRKMFI